MRKEPEEEKMHPPEPPARVRVTAQWLSRQREKQRRYERKRAAWRVKVKKPGE